MEIYIELAFLENFAVDAALLCLALLAARQAIEKRVLLAGLVGGAEGVIFPLLSLPAAAVYALKALGGILLAVLAAERLSFRKIFAVAAAFFLLTFAFGGMLTAIYSFFGVRYEAGEGYLVEQAPIGLVLGGGILFSVAAAKGIKRFYRRRTVQKSVVGCVLTQGERTLRWKGFADSGNLLFFRGRPVCVVSAQGLFAIFGRDLKETGRMTVKTVQGAEEKPVFLLDKLSIDDGTYERQNVYLTVGETGKETPILLHTALMEDQVESVRPAEKVDTKERGRKRCPLPLRK